MRSILPVLLSSLLLGCPPRLSDDDDASDDDVGDDDTSDDDAGDDDSDPDPSVCDLRDLAIDLQVFGDARIPRVTFSAADNLTLRGRVLNPCPIALTVTTSSGCLLDPWTFGRDGEPAEGRGCDDALMTWTVEPGGALSEDTQVGMLAPGAWTWTAGFGGWGPDGAWVSLPEATVTFEVVAPAGG